MLQKFEKSEKDGLEEYIIAIACSRILKEGFIKQGWSSGKEWYKSYLKNNKTA